MSGVAITLIMIFLFFFQGRIFESFRRIISLIVELIFKFLNLLGIKVNKKGHKLKTSKNFKNTFKEIKMVRESKENLKIKSSINWVAFVILVLSLIAIVINLKYGTITNYLYSIKKLRDVFFSKQRIDTMVTAITFSFTSLSLSKLMSQWKDTKKYRVAKREMRERQRLLKGMSSKDLLTIAKAKDEENLKEALKEDLNNFIDNETLQE